MSRYGGALFFYFALNNCYAMCSPVPRNRERENVAVDIEMDWNVSDISARC